MDGGSFLPIKSVVEHGIRTGLLIRILTLVDTTTVFANKVLSMLLFVLGLVVFCLVHRGSDKMGKMRNNDPVSKKLTFRPCLCCKDLVFMQHIVLLGVKPLKRINLLLGLLISGRD